MKKAAAILLILLSAAFSGCSERTGKEEFPSDTVISEDNPEQGGNENISEPFSSYAFEFSGTSENYMIFVKQGEKPDEISVTVENNLYESRDFVITAPSGYEPVYPVLASDASDVVKLIKNDINRESVPDIMQIGFSPVKDERDAEKTSYEVCRMYTVDDKGELAEIKIVGFEENEEGERRKVVRDCLDRTQLYHCEPLKFIYEINVDDMNIYDEEGMARPVENRVKIRTLSFDPKALILTEGVEKVSEQNPLYFGYACWAAANSAARCFTVSTFKISDWDNYIERIQRGDEDELSEYYFRIDDPRFENTRDLKMYLNAVFTPEEAERIFNEAPQKYTDIKGGLYGVSADVRQDTSLGILTFSGFTVGNDRMMFFSRQEKFDEKGDFTGYTDGGNFVIEKGADGLWKVSSYRYPYSIN